MDTIGASHSIAAARHFSSGTMSLSDVEYSRMRPQPVQVRLQVCSGSSCKTMANFGVLRSLCLMMCPAILAESARGNRINLILSGQRNFLGIFGQRSRGVGRRRTGLHQPRQEKRGGRNALAGVDTATTGAA